MKLKFKGKDGSMGLRHGEIYDAGMYAYQGYVWVTWLDNGMRRRCPYSSIKTLMDNWEDA